MLSKLFHDYKYAVIAVTLFTSWTFIRHADVVLLSTRDVALERKVKTLEDRLNRLEARVAVQQSEMTR